MTRAKPKTAAPDDLDREQRLQLITWIRSRPHLAKLGRNRKMIRLLVDECLSHHRAKGNEFHDWVATCRTWITREYKFKLEKQTAEKPQMQDKRGALPTPLQDVLEGMEKFEGE